MFADCFFYISNYMINERIQTYYKNHFNEKIRYLLLHRFESETELE